ncbi:MAG: sugar ABC transporter permease [Bacillota bacterium]|nr:sugar ABC transporter permease [Bacillota bacterium]
MEINKTKEVEAVLVDTAKKKKEKQKKPMTLAARSALTGYGFIAIWIIGFLFIFAKPMLLSFIYSFSKVRLGRAAVRTTFIGLRNYKYIFNEDPFYTQNIFGALSTMLYEVPIISIFSMFIASMLNQEFKGRTFARVLFFLPVIIASGVTIQILKEGGMSTTMSTSTDSVYLFQSTALKDLLMSTGFNSKFIETMTSVIDKIFDITWKSGVQILLYLSGLQTIPKSYYEVSSMEGATAWEEFWKITFPMLMPITLVCVIYTIIDSFTYYDNPVMLQIKDSFKALEFGHASAMSIIFCIIIFVLVVLVTKTVFRSVSDKVE